MKNYKKSYKFIYELAAKKDNPPKETFNISRHKNPHQFAWMALYLAMKEEK